MLMKRYKAIINKLLINDNTTKTLPHLEFLKKCIKNYGIEFYDPFRIEKNECNEPYSKFACWPRTCIKMAIFYLICC